MTGVPAGAAPWSLRPAAPRANSPAMRFPLICWLAACLPLAAGTLKFEETKKEILVQNEESTVTTDFPFKNESDSDAIIEKYDSGCSCISAGVKDSKLAYKPGESGTIRAVFNMAQFTGTTEKSIAVWLKGDPANKPSIILTARITIPELVEINPKSVIWEVGSKPEPKTVTLTIKHPEPIKVVSMTGADARFKQELKTIEEGKKYEVVITPASTDKVGMGVIHLETDCKIERHRSHRIFTMVRLPVAKQSAAVTK